MRVKGRTKTKRTMLWLSEGPLEGMATFATVGRVEDSGTGNKFSREFEVEGIKTGGEST